jgi:hypothetical protein
MTTERGDTNSSRAESIRSYRRVPSAAAVDACLDSDQAERPIVRDLMKTLNEVVQLRDS